uniref:Uncharacterized protein n=1 Tax=Romanomermis culicivorax TaxID=13658 RepID=A0A915I938_ROMCU
MLCIMFEVFLNQDAVGQPDHFGRGGGGMMGRGPGDSGHETMGGGGMGFRGGPPMSGMGDGDRGRGFEGRDGGDRGRGFRGRDGAGRDGGGRDDGDRNREGGDRGDRGGQDYGRNDWNNRNDFDQGNGGYDNGGGIDWSRKLTELFNSPTVKTTFLLMPATTCEIASRILISLWRGEPDAASTASNSLIFWFKSLARTLYSFWATRRQPPGALLTSRDN